MTDYEYAKNLIITTLEITPTDERVLILLSQDWDRIYAFVRDTRRIHTGWAANLSSTTKAHMLREIINLYINTGKGGRRSCDD